MRQTVTHGSVVSILNYHFFFGMRKQEPEKAIREMGELNDLRHKLLPHPPYSPDFLFSDMKKWLGGMIFANDEIITQTNAYVQDLDKSNYLEGIKTLEKRLTKCMELKEDYVEK